MSFLNKIKGWGQKEGAVEEPNTPHDAPFIDAFGPDAAHAANMSPDIPGAGGAATMTLDVPRPRPPKWPTSPRPACKSPTRPRWPPAPACR